MNFQNLNPANWGRRNLPVRRSFDYPSVGNFDDMFDEFFSVPPFPAFEAMETRFIPQLDVRDKQNEIEITAELPGMEEKDIDISLDQNLLTIAGEKKMEHEETRKGFHRMERQYGSFSRSVRLPDGVDTDKVSASFKNGIVCVTIPKTDKYRSGVKRIPFSGPGSGTADRTNETGTQGS